MQPVIEVPAILNQYFDTWVSHDRMELARLFTRDAIYDIIGKRTLRGLEEIDKYWQRIASYQSEVQWSVQASAQIGNQVIAQWHASFFHLNRDAICNLHGLMWLTINDHRIRALRECYWKTLSTERVHY